jgi:putative ubiquitin-RnfH superfamily antitoxin RatB of RatAB toxin-antitoxin module
MIRIQVIYALPLDQHICCLDVPPGTTIAQAIALSGNARHMSKDCTVARFGRPVALDAVVCEQDRIEILRGLEVDPKEARRRRQAHRERRAR